MKAIEIATRAVEEDEKQNYEEAYHLYCQGLQYFVPLILAEGDLTRRLQLQDRATNYLQRAEEIKSTCQRVYAFHRQSSENCDVAIDSGNAQPSTSTSTNRQKIETALKPSDKLSQLCEYRVDDNDLSGLLNKRKLFFFYDQTRYLRLRHRSSMHSTSDARLNCTRTSTTFRMPWNCSRRRWMCWCHRWKPSQPVHGRSCCTNRYEVSSFRYTSFLIAIFAHAICRWSLGWRKLKA